MAGETIQSSIQTAKRRSLYAAQIIGVDRTAMALLSILLISSLYAGLELLSVHKPPLYLYVGSLLLPGLGTVFAEDVDEPRFGIYLRSSTDDSDHGAAREHQRKVLERAIDRVDGRQVRTIERVESGATMDRESLDELAEMAANDRLDVIGVMNIDRLTRAPPIEAASYYRRLNEHDCLLYSQATQFIDISDVDDYLRLMRQTGFAHKWYKRIMEGTEGSHLETLKDGEYPYGKAPFGFEVDDGEISVREGEREFLYRAFETYKRLENRQKATRKLNDRREQQGRDLISESQLKTVLSSELCIGRFTFEGNVVHKDPELRVVDEKTFYDVQEITKERANTTGQSGLPEAIGGFVDRFGVDYLLEVVDTLEPTCPQSGCSGEMEEFGTENVWNLQLQNYRCKECSYQGPVLREKELKRIHQVAPLSCPFCQSTEAFEYDEIPGMDEYRYTCQRCEQWFKAPVSPDKLQRALNMKVAFDLKNWSQFTRFEQASGNSTRSPPSSTTDQESLGSFSP